MCQSQRLCYRLKHCCILYMIDLYGRFEVPYRLRFHLHILGLPDLEGKDATILRNVCNDLQIYAV